MPPVATATLLYAAFYGCRHQLRWPPLLPLTPIFTLMPLRCGRFHYAAAIRHTLAIIFMPRLQAGAAPDIFTPLRHTCASVAMMPARAAAARACAARGACAMREKRCARSTTLLMPRCCR